MHFKINYSQYKEKIKFKRTTKNIFFLIYQTYAERLQLLPSASHEDDVVSINGFLVKSHQIYKIKS